MCGCLAISFWFGHTSTRYRQVMMGVLGGTGRVKRCIIWNVAPGGLVQYARLRKYYPRPVLISSTLCL